MRGVPRALFDAYLMVDWSGAGVPARGRDSIWIAHARRSGSALEIAEPLNAPTRDLAERHLAQVIDAHLTGADRVLVGFDFAFGYPSGFAQALRLRGTGPAWRRTWAALAEMVRDGANNANNRFAVAAALNRRLGRPPGPFWCCPARAAGATLETTRPIFPFRARSALSLPEYREADCRLRAAGRYVQSVWKLYTAGSVGSQTLLGIPRVAALRSDARRADVSRGWPFEAASPGRPLVLHVEIWPGMVPLEVLHPVKDAAQVLTMVRARAGLDAAGDVRASLERPRRLTGTPAAACLGEEGWILGA